MSEIGLVNIEGKGKLIPELDYLSFLEAVYSSFNQIAIEIAANDSVYLGDLEQAEAIATQKIEYIESQLDKALDVSIPMQARYERVMNDLMQSLVSTHASIVYNQYKNNNRIIR